MNCKPGDIALIVKRSTTLPSNLNKMVRVIERWNGSADPEWLCEALQPMLVNGAAGIREVPAGYVAVMSDSSLRPIRDQPGQDETLTWAGLPAPQRVAEPA